MPIVDHKVKESCCPQCGKMMDGAMGLDGDLPPEPGDISVCIDCQEILQFQPDGTLGIAPPELLADVALKQPQFHAFLLRVQRTIAEVQKQRRGRDAQAA